MPARTRPRRSAGASSKKHNVAPFSARTGTRRERSALPAVLDVGVVSGRSWTGSMHHKVLLLAHILS